jgi:hypothetical protein
MNLNTINYKINCLFQNNECMYSQYIHTKLVLNYFQIIRLKILIFISIKLQNKKGKCTDFNNG